MEKHRYTNSLTKEKSPYLLLNAHDPVDWHPWGEETFAKARKEEKPIFLSIGYSTCHWCHIMRQESFENEEIAAMLNDVFINVKVDKEEMPDVDGLYMEIAQAIMAGAAGWPLNLVLSHELIPIFVSTYLPPVGRPGQMGMKEMITNIKNIWTGIERPKAIAQAERIMKAYSSGLLVESHIVPPENYIEMASAQFFQLADPIHGGLKGQPKFLVGYQANFLSRVAKRYSDSRALFFAEKTLEMMYRGGVYDHLGGGFSRYSIDDAWRLPHFEKMMFDNAIQAQAYLEIWQATQCPMYREVCEQIIEYILAELTNDEGAFLCAQDADRIGAQTGFYTWSYKEVIDILGEQSGRIFCDFYGITEYGNYDGRSIIHIPFTLSEFSMKLNIDPELLSLSLTEGRRLLFEERKKRPPLFKDDKVMTSWNALMIYTLVEVGVALGNSRYLEAAERAALFIKNNMQKDGHLLRRWREGSADHYGLLNDYTYLIRALLSLFEANRGIEWLKWALELEHIVSREFRDLTGAFFFTDGLDPTIIFQRCHFLDSSEPSGNAIHCENLQRLYRITQDQRFMEYAEGILGTLKKRFDQYLLGHCYHLMAMMRYYDTSSPTFVIALDSRKSHKKEIEQLIYESYLPHKTILWKEGDDEGINEAAPWVKGCKPIDDKTTVYIQRKGELQEPMQELQAISETIKAL